MLKRTKTNLQLYVMYNAGIVIFETLNCLPVNDNYFHLELQSDEWWLYAIY